MRCCGHEKLVAGHVEFFYEHTVLFTVCYDAALIRVAATTLARPWRGMGATSDVDSLARNVSAACVRWCFGSVLVFILLVDVASIVLLGWEQTWSLAALAERLGDFKHDSADLLLLFCVRVAVVSLLARLACALGKHPHDSAIAPLLRPLREPLIQRPPSNDLQAHVTDDARSKRTAAALAVSLLVTAAAQLYVGVKALSFQSTVRAEALLFGVMVLAMGAEVWLLHRLVHALTSPKGFKAPTLHRHSLLFAERPGAQCDMVATDGLEPRHRLTGGP